jgi:hypothetical protein
MSHSIFFAARPYAYILAHESKEMKRSLDAPAWMPGRPPYVTPGRPASDPIRFTPERPSRRPTFASGLLFRGNHRLIYLYVSTYARGLVGLTPTFSG